MEFKIVNKQVLASDVKRVDIQAPAIARKVQPGQFVVVLVEEGGAWIPLTVAENDVSRGLVTLIFKEVGESTRLLGNLQISDSVFSVMGPFGKPATVEHVGTVICAAYGVGIASMLPVARAFKNQGNKVIGIIGAETKRQIMLESQMRLACKRIFIVTRDGSYERLGEIEDVVREVVGQETVNLIYTIAPGKMMEAINAIAQDQKIQCLVQVTSHICCGMGLCGSCRVHVGRQEMLACQAGPEFSGQQVDYQNLKAQETAGTDRQHDDGKQSVEEKAIAKFFPGLSGRW